jgi:hypothetical protein
MTARILTLDILLAEGTDSADVISDINASILCALEEDKKTITSWKWSE